MNELEKTVRAMVTDAINSEMSESDTVDIITRDIFSAFSYAVELSSDRVPA